MNKFGDNPGYARNVRNDIEGVPLDKLISSYGSPLFVFSEQRMRRKYRAVHDAFATRYPKVTFG